MNIKKAYETHKTIENLSRQDEMINTLYKAISNYESFEKGELIIRGARSPYDEKILYSVQVEKEHIKLLLNLLLESMTDKKERSIKKIEEL